MDSNIIWVYLCPIYTLFYPLITSFSSTPNPGWVIFKRRSKSPGVFNMNGLGYSGQIGLEFRGESNFLDLLVR